MRTGKRFRVLAQVCLAGALVLSGGTAMAAPTSAQANTCTGGEIPSGTYSSLTVAGYCTVPAGADITVVGNINLEPGAFLDAQAAPATISVGHNVTAAEGSLLGLGCQPPSYTGNSGHPCYSDSDALEVRTTITVQGNVTATDAHTVALNGVTVMGNVTLTGGGNVVPWSVKNNDIRGNLTVGGQTVEWLGVLFNHIGKNATLTDIAITEDHPGAAHAVYVVRNTITRNLTCMGLVEGVANYGNVVGRNAIGQCAPA